MELLPINVELTFEDRLLIVTLLESELKKFKPYRKCASKKIPDWWKKRINDLFEKVDPDNDMIWK